MRDTRIVIQLPDGIAALERVMCGCGNHDAAYRVFLEHLKRCAKEDKPLPPDPMPGEWIIVEYLLDHLGLTEHGSTVLFSWLMADGEDAIEFLEQWGTDWTNRDDVEFVTKDGAIINP